MSLNAPLIRSSFESMRRRDPGLVRHFFDHLFEHHPELAPHFENLPRQALESEVTATLVSLLGHLEDESRIRRQLGALGERNLAYGITPLMYELIGESVLGTLARVAGDDWDDALRDAWSQAYAFFVRVMVAGTEMQATG